MELYKTVKPVALSLIAFALVACSPKDNKQYLKDIKTVSNYVAIEKKGNFTFQYEGTDYTINTNLTSNTSFPTGGIEIITTDLGNKLKITDKCGNGPGPKFDDKNERLCGDDEVSIDGLTTRYDALSDNIRDRSKKAYDRGIYGVLRLISTVK